MTANVVLGLCAYTHDSAAALLVDGHLIGFVEEERLDGVKHSKAYPAHGVAWLLDRGRPDAVGRDHGRVQLRRAPLPTRAGSTADPSATGCQPRPSRTTGPQLHHGPPPLPGPDARPGRAFPTRPPPASAAPPRAWPVRLRRLRCGRRGGPGRRQPRRVADHHHRPPARRNPRLEPRPGRTRSTTRPRSATPTAPSPNTWAGGAVTRKAPSWPWPPSATPPGSASLLVPRDPADHRPGSRSTPALFPLRVLPAGWPGSRPRSPPRPARRAPADEHRSSQVHADLAAALQERTEQVMLHLARRARAADRRAAAVPGRRGRDELRQPSARSLEAGLFDEVYVPPAPGDSGTAIGAAARRLLGTTGRPPTGDRRPSCYLGPAYPDFTPGRSRAPGLTRSRQVAEPARFLAEQLADGADRGPVPGAAGGRAAGAGQPVDPRLSAAARMWSSG